MSDQLQLFAQIGIVGAGLSFFIQMVKVHFGDDSDTTRAIVIVASILLGVGFYFIVNTPLWLPIIGILGTATTIHSLFLRK